VECSIALLRCFPNLQSLTLTDCLDHTVLSILPESLAALTLHGECEDAAAAAIAMQCLGRLPALDSLELMLLTVLDVEAWTQLLRACPPQLKTLVSDWSHDVSMCAAAQELLVDSAGARSQWLPLLAELVSIGRGFDFPEGPNEAWDRLDPVAQRHGIHVALEIPGDELGGKAEASGA
jgi:hypothetical protein